MKKIFSIVLAVLFTLPFIAFPAHAIVPGEDAMTPVHSYSTNDLLEIAIDAFPEYEFKIKGYQHQSSAGMAKLSTITEPVLLKMETRELDGGISVTYQEYSNGITFSSIALHGGQNVTNTSLSNGFTYVTLNMYLVCSVAVDSFLVEDIELKYKSSDYGEILNDGTAYGDGTPTPIITAFKARGTSSSSGYLEYGTYVTMKDFLDTTFDLYPYLCLTITPSGYSVSASWSSILG